MKIKAKQIKYKKRIVGCGNSNIFVVICRMNNGKWVFSDFWGLPYTARGYYEAMVMKKKIIKRACKIRLWRNEDFTVIKATI